MYINSKAAMKNLSKAAAKKKASHNTRKKWIIIFWDVHRCILYSYIEENIRANNIEIPYIIFKPKRGEYIIIQAYIISIYYKE